MPTTSIKISQLDPIASLTGSDFFPIDQSSSIKTYRASLTQLQNLFSTGSFTGSLTGRITGTGTSPQFVGTSSWAISSSRAISSSYSDFSNSSSYALSASRSETASYALNSNAGDLSGAGTTNYVPIWTGNKTLGDSKFYLSSSQYFLKNIDPSYTAFNIEQSNSGQSFLIVSGHYNSSWTLRNYNTSSDSWTMVVSGDGEDTLSPGVKGGLDWSTYTSNSLFTSKQPTVIGTYQDITRMMRVKSSGIYFWPLSSVQSLSKDSTFNIGVDSGTQNTTTRFLIDVYSGSNASNPVINHVQKAIEVRYGSSSLSTTFCVSSSGQVTATGYSGSNFNAVSFYGSASYALSSSNAVTASYAMNTPTNNSNVRVPVFATTSSNVSLVGTTNFNLILSLYLPSGYTTWDEFSIRANLCVDNTNGGYVTGSLCYGDGILFSLTSGSGNSNQVYSYDNSDDSITPTWEYFGLVTGSKNTDNPLVLSASFNYTAANITSRYIYARAYAKN